MAERVAKSVGTALPSTGTAPGSLIALSSPPIGSPAPARGPPRGPSRAVRTRAAKSGSEKVEALYDQPAKLPADAEGTEMAKLRREMHRRMLGNGYCARPVELDCHFESICEGCGYFETGVEFLPVLKRQRDHALEHDQRSRHELFERLVSRAEGAS